MKNYSYIMSLSDELIYLRQKDFDLYFHDLAKFSRSAEYHDTVSKYPFL